MPNKNLFKGLSALWMLATAWTASAATPWSVETHQLAFGDFNGDGKTDLLYVANDPGLSSGIVLADANGAPTVNHQSWASNYLGIPWHSGTYQPLVADFNGDGKADVFLHRQAPSGDSYLLFANSSGQINAIAQTFGYNLGGQIWTGDAHRIVAGDFNGDGKSDLFLQAVKAADLNAVFLASSGGTFSSAQQTWGDSYMGFRWSLQRAVIHAGDFNADGKADLLVQAKPDIVIIDYDVPFPVPVYKSNSFGIVNAKTPDGSGALFYGSALQFWNRDYLGLDWSAANFDVIVGNFNGTGGADIFLQGKRAGLQNRLLLAGSGGQFTSSDALVDTTLRNATGDQYRLHAANFDGTSPVGLYLQAKTAGGTNQIAATITGTATLISHDPNLLNVVTPGTAVGSIPGSFAVDPNGGASYQIPITVPPGVAKIQPALSLAYSSRGGNGALGVGWQLTGVSSISRCPTTVAQDGAGNQDGADLDLNDAFCLDGQRLITAGANGAVGATYRTEIESFQHVISSLGESGNPGTFLVREKGGLDKYYGTQPDSTSEDASFEARRGSTTGKVAVWAIRRIKDRFDNFIEYRYDQEAAALEFRPVEIIYGSKFSTSKTVVGRVVFEYSSRIDTFEGYVAGGFKASLTKRLTKISTFGRADPTIPGANDRVSQYYFNYEYSPTTGLSHLANIVLCDGGSGAVQKCVNSTKFQWQHGYRGFTASSEATDVDFGSLVDLKMFDADGDGRTDYVYRHTSGNNQGQWLIRYASLVHSRGDGGYVPTGIAVNQPDRAFAMDWNNDGYGDLVDSTESSGGNYRVAFGRPTGINLLNVALTSLSAEGLTNKGLGTTVGDFDGDGRQDIAYTPGGASTLKVRLNNSAIPADGLLNGTTVSTSFSAATAPPSPEQWIEWDFLNASALTTEGVGNYKSEPSVYTINFDGDGKDDLLVRVRACYRRLTPDEHTWEQTCQPEFQVFSLVGGTLQRVWAVQAGYHSVLGTFGKKHLKLGDFNGDGITDVLSWGGDFVNGGASSGWYLSLGTAGVSSDIQTPNFAPFVTVMSATSLTTTAVCADGDFTAFENPIFNAFVQAASCSAGGAVALTEELLDSVMPFDYNRDGFTDLLIARDGFWQVMPGGPNGYVNAILTTSRQATQAKRALLVDDAADGLPDILFPWGSAAEDNWHVLYGRGPAVSGVIELITDGLGAQTQIQYATTTATTDQANYVGVAYKGHTRYPEDPNSATPSGFRTVQPLGWPNTHLAAPIPVVYQYIADNGNGTPGSAAAGIRTTLQYWGLKMNREGRGQLGFSEVQAWNDNSEIETRTRYAQQTFPMFGNVLTYEQRFRDQGTITTSLAAGTSVPTILLFYTASCDTNPICATATPQTNTLYDENAAYNRVNYSTNLLGARVVPYGSRKVYIPYTRKRTEDTHPVTNGTPGTNPYRRVVTEVLANSTSTADQEYNGGSNSINPVDDWGNPGATRVTVTNGTTGGSVVSRDEHVDLTTGSYQTPDTTNWCISKLTSSTVKLTKPATNTAGNSHALNEVTRTGTFTYSGGGTCELVSETGPSGLTKTFTHDSYGNVIAERLSGTGIPVNEERVSGTYLSDGVTSSYDSTQGQFPTQARNSLGHAEQSTWDGRFGVAKTQTGPNGITGVALYDSFGRKVRETPVSSLAAAYSESSIYWCANTGMCWDTRAVYTVRVTSSDGSQSYTEYDRVGRPIETRETGFDGNWIASETYFDPLGRPYLTSRPYKPATQTTKCWDFVSYDALGRKVTSWGSYSTSECTSTVIAFNAVPTGGRQSQTAYDLISSAGNSTKVLVNSSDSSTYATARVGYSTVNVMDRVRFVRDDLTSSGCPSDGSSVVANTSTCLQTEYDYDAPGNLTYVKRVGALGGAPVATTIETKNWHDSIGRKYQMSDPDMGTWYYTHTPFGELDTQTDAKGQFTDLGYDRLGRVTRRLEKLSVNGAIETDTNFVFDTAPMGVGKIASVSTNNGFSEWTSYDSLGRFSQSKRQLDGAYYYVDQTYDGLGRPDVLKYPGSIAGDTVSGPETDANRVRVRNNYNSYGYLSSVQDVASGTSYWNANAVDENGGVTQETLGNGRVTKRFFDRPTGYISTIKTGSAANDSEVQNLEFGFDQAANLRTRKDSTTGVNGDNGIREEYNYDKLYRLTQMRQYKPASSAGPQSVTENYTYDDFGNLLSKGTNYNDYCYIARNVANDPCAGVASVRPHAAKRVKLGATTRDYSYDANGNVTAATFSMFDSVTWNVSNLPKRISKGTKYSEFSYGADRARFKQYLYRAANDTETTIYVGSLYEKLTKVVGGTPTVEHTHYIAVNGNVVTLAKRTGTGSIWLRYPHRDQLGSIVALTNESGALVERSGFDPWGKRTSYATWDATTPGTYTAGGTGTGGLLSGMLSTKRGFTYHEHVEELGFVHMNGRVYDNEIGRFLSADPFIQFPLSTQGFNRYSYVGNNPLSYTDPSGFEINKGALGKVLWEVGAILTNFGGWIEWVGRLFMAVGAYLQNRGNTQAWLAWLTNSLPKYNVSFAPTPSQSVTYGGGSTTSQPPPVPVNSFGPITFPLDFHYNKEGTAGGIARGGWEIVVQIWNYPVIEHRVQVKRYVGTMSPGGKGNIFGVSGALYAPVFDSARKPVTQVVSSISVGDVVLTAATIIPVVAGLRAAFVLEAAVARGLGWSAARGSGTVWESITVTQAAKSGTAIPHSFELATAGGKFWVHPNATKHMVEFVTRNGGSQGMQMNSQAMLSSLHASVEQAASQGIRFGQTMQVGRWELIFSQARTADELPVLIHALYR